MLDPEGNVLGSSGLGAVALGFARRHSTYQALRDRGDRALSVRDLIQRELFDSVQDLFGIFRYTIFFNMFHIVSFLFDICFDDLDVLHLSFNAFHSFDVF